MQHSGGKRHEREVRGECMRASVASGGGGDMNMWKDESFARFIALANVNFFAKVSFHLPQDWCLCI